MFKRVYMNYNIKLNIKSLCLFEQITGQNFFKISQENIDIYMLDLIYAVLLANNDFEYSLDVFKQAFEKNKKFATEINKICIKLFSSLKSIYSFKPTETEEKQSNVNKDIMSISDISYSLIVLYGIDAHYVMYEMELWEIAKMFEMVEQKIQRKQAEDRFWSYIQVSPYLPKNVKSPEDLVRFSWEKESKQDKALKDLEMNKDKILAALSDGSDNQNN